jgi:alkanesulfonate monooxygenase SsuD/methylene tetrahydromethanopterin reductase-like flavin-dependent oxidoreductase (luciferase family)
MLPRPFQRPHPPMLVATARTPESCEAAGTSGYGLMMVPSINKVEQVRDMLDLYRSAWTRAGHDPAGQAVHMSYNCYVAEDDDEARRLGRKYSEYTNRVMADAVEAWSRTSSDDYRGYDQVLDKIRGADFDRQLRESKVLVGDPGDVTAKLTTIRDWFGDVTISLQVISGNQPVEESIRSMRLFARHVLPRFPQPEPTP